MKKRSDKKLSIVLPSYNVLPYLKHTLLSLAQNTYHNFELIIIDDNSNEETKEFLSAISDICTVIYNKNQKYVTSNWNTGIRMATGDYIAIINNDLKFSKHWDLHLMKALEDPDTWIASPYLTDPLDPEPFANVQRFNNIMLAGPCFMIKKEMIQHTGYIPECTRIWYNDVWFSWITTQVFNKKSVFIRDALIHHYKSKSSEAMSELMRSKFVEIISADEKAFKKIQSDFETKGILYKEE